MPQSMDTKDLVKTQINKILLDIDMPNKTNEV